MKKRRGGEGERELRDLSGADGEAGGDLESPGGVSDSGAGASADSGGLIGRRAGRKRVDLDARAARDRKSRGEKAERGKLTKAGRKSLEAWKGDQRSKQRDAYFARLGEKAREKFGHGSVLVGSDANQLILGIPMPSLSLEWLIQQDVLPLSVVIVLVGRWRTCKSALLYEIFRWFAKHNGGAILLECETKFSPDLCQSIMGYADDETQILLSRCNSLEDWQRYLTFHLGAQKQAMIGTASEPGPGRTIPVCFGVDSIMGKASEEKHERVVKEGAAGRSYPIEALKIAEYLRTVTHQFDNWPFSLVLVNHLKEHIDQETQRTERRKPGGGFVSFQGSFELETSIWRERIDTSAFDGVGIRIACEKNALGVTGRRIKTRMLWWDEQVDESRSGPVFRQRTVWDWDWATVAFLHELQPKYKQRLQGVDFTLDVKSPGADVECRANCRAVGMGDGEFLSFSEVGALIRKDDGVCDRIRTALSIKRRAVLDGDYLEQLEGARDDLP